MSVRQNDIQMFDHLGHLLPLDQITSQPAFAKLSDVQRTLFDSVIETASQALAADAELKTLNRELTQALKASASAQRSLKELRPPLSPTAAAKAAIAAQRAAMGV